MSDNENVVLTTTKARASFERPAFLCAVEITALIDIAPRIRADSPMASYGPCSGRSATGEA
jgi:hypothetical protein